MDKNIQNSLGEVITNSKHKHNALANTKFVLISDTKKQTDELQLNVDSDTEEKKELLENENNNVSKEEKSKQPAKDKTCANKRKENASRFNDEHDEKMSKFETIKNLVILSVSFMLLFSAWMSFQNLQSTLNKEGGLGTIGLSLLYITIMFASMFLSPLTLSKFSDKWIIVFAMMCYLVFLATGFYADWSTIIPGSIVIGIGAAHLWPAKLRYVSQLAKRYAVTTNTKEENATSLFFGIFFSILFTNQIWGNLASSLLFQQPPTNGSIIVQNQSCGAAFCPQDNQNNSNLQPPTTKQMNTYIGFCLGLGGFAVACMAIFLPNIPQPTQTPKSLAKRIKSVMRHIVYSRKQKLLLVSTVFRGMSQAFALGDFTLAFVSCPLGVEYVGFVMITYGVSSSVFSLIFGRMSKYTGHFFLFIIAFVVQLSVSVTMLHWEPTADQSVVIFALAGLWSLCDAVYCPTITALYSLHFRKDKEAAIATFRLLDAIGFSLSFGYSSFLCTYHKLYIILAVLSTSLASLILFQINERKATSNILEYEVEVSKRRKDSKS